MSQHTLTRRGALGAAGVAGVAYLVGGVPQQSSSGFAVDDAVAATCVMTPARTEGPYFVDEKLNRSDIREDQPGVPLVLTMHVFDGRRRAGGHLARERERSLSNGEVTFTTIYPGWYSGRTIHIHFKVRKDDLEFTSQMFFTDEQNADVMKQSPYSKRGNPDTTDSTDNIYGSDGAKLLLQPQSDGSGGYTAEFSVGVSGGSSGETAGTDTSVAASVLSVRATRSRRIRSVVQASEPVTAVVTVSRSGKTLARVTKRLATGSHAINLAVRRTVAAGAATVRVRLSDGAGNVKTAKRTVHIPGG